MINRLERLKNTVNKYMAYIRPNRLTTCHSERKSFRSRHPSDCLRLLSCWGSKKELLIAIKGRVNSRDRSSWLLQLHLSPYNYKFPRLQQRIGSGVTHPPTQSVPGALSLGIRRQGPEADHSPPTSAKVKKMWIYTSTPSYVFMA
jgi:hypothetical protein